MIACIRIPDVPLWAVCQLEPELVDRPVIVQRGDRVLTCSAHLPAEIHPGMPLARAQALSQQVCEVALRGDPENHCDLIWEEALGKLNACTPRLLSVERGIALAQLSESEAYELVQEIPACVGLAADRQTALLAALAAEPFRKVRPGGEKAFADRLSVLVLSGAGVAHETLQRLVWLGFPTVGEVQRLTLGQLRERFGAEQGELLFRLSRPCRDTAALPLYLPPEELCLEQPAESVWREAGEVLEATRSLLRQALEKLRPRLCSRFTLGLQGDLDLQRARRILKQPSARFARLWPPLETELVRLLERGAQEFERLTLALGGLRPAPTLQGTLFRERSLLKPALQNLHSRFPGKLLRIQGLDGNPYLPEESFAFREAL